MRVELVWILSMLWVWCYDVKPPSQRGQREILALQESNFNVSSNRSMVHSSWWQSIYKVWISYHIEHLEWSSCLIMNLPAVLLCFVLGYSFWICRRRIVLLSSGTFCIGWVFFRYREHYGTKDSIPSHIWNCYGNWLQILAI